METRILGNDLEVSAVGLGCMGFSHASGAPTEKSVAVKTLREAYEMGYTFFDTAECYTGVNPDGSTSYNEELVGEALRDVRDKVVIATKCGVHHAPDQSLILDRSPATLRALYDAGYHFDSVNVGNMAKKDNSTQIGKSVCVTPQDVEDFRYLDGKGVSFGMQRVPTEASESLMDKL